jgi:predicted O-methyltransferase YrrM
MRMRWLAVIGAVAWIATVIVVAAVSDLGAATATLFGLLGLMVVAALVLGLTLHKLLLRIDARRTKPAKVPAAEPLGDADLKRIAGLMDRELKRTFRQVEALQNLYGIIPIEHALPASRGFPASPDLLLFLVDMVDRHRPKVIVECGSGLSTLCLALAMRRFGIDGKVIALEHLAQYAAQTEELLHRHGVADLAEVRTAPLEDFTFGEETTPWYSRSAWEDIEGVDLLFVDGPPAKLGPLARYPSLPFFVERLAPGAQIVLDDYARTKERVILERWESEYPGRLSVESIPLEKGAALVTLS